MRRSMTRGEWLLIGLPPLAFVAFAALYVRWKAARPAVLNPSPVPLRSLLVNYDGRKILGLGSTLDANNYHPPGTPWQFLRWSTKDGKIDADLSENRPFYSWTFSRDGEQLALHIPGSYKKTTTTGQVVVRRMADGTETASWPLTSISRYLRGLLFSPDGREIITFDNVLERHDLQSGKLLGSLKASQVFSSRASFEQVNFSPNGRFVAVIEGAFYPEEEAIVTPDKLITRSYAHRGGHMAILTFPELKTVWRPRGDLYSTCSWDSDSHLWAVAPMLAGDTPQKLVRASIDLQNKQAQLSALEFPKTASIYWDPETLAVSGATGQVLMVNRDSSTSNQTTLWGPDGKIETSFNFRFPKASASGTTPPDQNARPRFLNDGNSLIRINGKEIERYDLSRYLPEATSMGTPAP